MRDGRAPSALGVAVLAAASCLLAAEARGQDFTIPLGVAHHVVLPGEPIVEPQEGRWTLGLGTLHGLDDEAGDGVVAQASWGGPYHTLAFGAGWWNGGFPGAEDALGAGLNFHYNVFQSRDARTRVGHQLGWSAVLGGERSHSLTYRPRATFAPSEAVALFGGVGGRTTWTSRSGRPDRATNASAVAGFHVRLGERFGVSAGVESVFADPPRLALATSVQFTPGDGAAARP